MFLIWPKVLEKGRFFIVIDLIFIESESSSWIWITYSNWLYHANERTRHCCLKIFLIEQLSILVVTEFDCLLHEMYLKNWLYLNYSFVFKKSFDILRLDINVTPIETHKIISLHRFKVIFGSQVSICSRQSTFWHFLGKWMNEHIWFFCCMNHISPRQSFKIFFPTRVRIIYFHFACSWELSDSWNEL